MEKSRVRALEKWKNRPRLSTRPASADGVQKVRRAAAEVQLHDIAIAIEQRRHHFRFAHQALGVRRAAAHVARDDSIASAVEAR